jgi:L,D-transpeptidase catalytic domain
MKQRIKAVYLVLSSLLIAILQLPLAFAKPLNNLRLVPKAVSDSITLEPSSSTFRTMKSVYDSLHLDLKGLSRQAFDYAKKGLEKLVSEHKVSKTSIVTVIDFSLPSYKKRMFVIDLDHYKILFNTLVAHGRNSGDEWTNSFSNDNESHKSSPGFYVTRETYEGHNGYSLKLEGMERGINDKAYERGIVVHGAAYVSDERAGSGFIGRSFGCPAVPEQLATPIINTIKDGTCLFIYHPSYVLRSAMLN